MRMFEDWSEECEEDGRRAKAEKDAEKRNMSPNK